MRVTTLNQIFGMLTRNRPSSGLAAIIPIRPVTERDAKNRATPVGQRPGDMMPIS